MSLKELSITNLRNIKHLHIEPSNNFNLLIGQNGSGKTSFLEAINYLSLSRSFRSHKYKQVIRYESQSMVIQGRLHDSTSIGIEKTSTGTTRIKINGDNCNSAAMLTEKLPLLLINPDSYRVLDSGPKYRREFLDWGVFHVKHQFYDLWKKTSVVIKQRNSALRQGYSFKHLAIWDKELVLAAKQLDSLRQEYMEAFQPLFNEIVTSLLNDKIELKYFSGWTDNSSLKDILEKSYERDKYLGYTQFGPHRSDLKLFANSIQVTDILSRGQQKLLIFALKIAQGILLYRQTGKSCIYLIDDLAAELDLERRTKITALLESLNAQVFVTAVEEGVLREMQEHPKSKMFHVKHGEAILRELAVL